MNELIDNAHHTKTHQEPSGLPDLDLDSETRFGFANALALWKPFSIPGHHMSDAAGGGADS